MWTKPVTCRHQSVWVRVLFFPSLVFIIVKTVVGSKEPNQLHVQWKKLGRGLDGSLWIIPFILHIPNGVTTGQMASPMVVTPLTREKCHYLSNLCLLYLCFTPSRSTSLIMEGTNPRGALMWWRSSKICHIDRYPFNLSGPAHISSFMMFFFAILNIVVNCSQRFQPQIF